MAGKAFLVFAWSMVVAALTISAESEGTLEEIMEQRREHIFRDCQDIFYFHQNELTDGIYTIEPHGAPGSFDVYCELDSDEVVWTWIQHREDGSVNFQLDWMAYKYGFGWLNKEFWLGNEKIYYLTNQASYKIRFEMTDDKDNSGYADYRYFHIEDEANFYRLRVGDFLEGTAGDSLADPNAAVYHADKGFTTIDADYDEKSGDNCASLYGGGGGWWYDGTQYCDYVNLNGEYCTSWKSDDFCIEWKTWKWANPVIKTTTIKITSNSHFSI